jgi:hypothetical protein
LHALHAALPIAGVDKRLIRTHYQQLPGDCRQLFVRNIRLRIASAMFGVTACPIGPLSKAFFQPNGSGVENLSLATETHLADGF